MGPVIEAFTAADVRAAEEPLLASERGFDGGLMQRAAWALDLTVRRELSRRVGRVPGSTVVALVGPGNNGGDALHALARLAHHGVRTVAVATSASIHESGLAALAGAGGKVLCVVDDAPGERVWMGEAAAEAYAADVVLDGLLGIGGRGGLRGAAAELVDILDRLMADRGAPAAVCRPLVVAVDVPSGVGVDDGVVDGPVLRADRTVTFGVAKPALLLPPAAHLAGQVDVVDLGLRERLAGVHPAVSRLNGPDVAALWPVPSQDDHKYTRGVVGVVAGSASYTGAAILTAAGALGVGCGMVRYAGSDVARRAVVAAHPEVVAGSATDIRAQAWVVGPGVADDDEQAGRARAAVAHAIADGLPLVVDAGGLDMLPHRLGPLVVLTPHAGELAHLLAGHEVQVTRDEVSAEPARWAVEAARRTGATVLLKGHTTVVAGPEVLFSQSDAPAWLATAGAGDVLAGVLGSLLAGRCHDVRADHGLAARLAAAAACVHGRAAWLAGPGPVTAGALARALPAAVRELVLPEPARLPSLARRRNRVHVHHAMRRVVR
jgi:hydroxyethylthiazole kinase-like uncharacterized protein yjeF